MCVTVGQDVVKKCIRANELHSTQKSKTLRTKFEPLTSVNSADLWETYLVSLKWRKLWNVSNLNLRTLLLCLWNKLCGLIVPQATKLTSLPNQSW